MTEARGAHPNPSPPPHTHTCPWADGACDARHLRVSYKEGCTARPISYLAVPLRSPQMTGTARRTREVGEEGGEGVAQRESARRPREDEGGDPPNASPTENAATAAPRAREAVRALAANQAPATLLHNRPTALSTAPPQDVHDRPTPPRSARQRWWRRVR